MSDQTLTTEPDRSDQAEERTQETRAFVRRVRRAARHGGSHWLVKLTDQARVHLILQQTLVSALAELGALRSKSAAQSRSLDRDGPRLFHVAVAVADGEVDRTADPRAT